MPAPMPKRMGRRIVPVRRPTRKRGRIVRSRKTKRKMRPRCPYCSRCLPCPGLQRRLPGAGRPLLHPNRMPPEGRTPNRMRPHPERSRPEPTLPTGLLRARCPERRRGGDGAGRRRPSTRSCSPSTSSRSSDPRPEGGACCGDGPQKRIRRQGGVGVRRRSARSARIGRATESKTM